MLFKPVNFFTPFLINKKESKPVSRVLYFIVFTINSCHLSAMKLTLHLNQPTHQDILFFNRLRTSSPSTLTYLAFQPTRFTLLHVTNTRRELLPHIFTLTTHCCGAVIFCGTCCRTIVTNDLPSR
jgi:hypothetical protein